MGRAGSEGRGVGGALHAAARGVGGGEQVCLTSWNLMSGSVRVEECDKEKTICIKLGQRWCSGYMGEAGSNEWGRKGTGGEAAFPKKGGKDEI